MFTTFSRVVFTVDPGELSLTASVLPAEGSIGADALIPLGELCTAVRRGEEWAVRDLHTRYSARLTRYALVITRGNEVSAAEAVQNAFLKAIRSLRTMPDENALWAWLARACRTSAMDEGRRARRYLAVLHRLTTLFSSAPAESPPQDTEAIWHAALDQALLDLDETDRQLIHARYTARTPLAETAATIGSTERAIEGRLARLREKLRQSILRQLSTDPHEN